MLGFSATIQTKKNYKTSKKDTFKIKIRYPQIHEVLLEKGGVVFHFLDLNKLQINHLPSNFLLLRFFAYIDNHIVIFNLENY